MSNLLLDIARAVVAGFETGQRTVAPDPVDEHAEQAAAVVNRSGSDDVRGLPPEAKAALLEKMARVAVAQLDDLREERDGLRVALADARRVAGIDSGKSLVERIEQLQRLAAERLAEKNSGARATTAFDPSRVTLGGMLMSAWHGSPDDLSTTERWRRVADTALGLLSPRVLAGTAHEEALRHLARSLNGVAPADEDHADRLDQWAHRDAEHLAAEMARTGLALVQTGSRA